MIRTVIIEDEAQNLERLVNLLLMHCPDVDVIGTACGVKTAFEFINSQHPELVFLDIQLIDGNAFNLLELYEEITFKLIFVTAYEKYAVKAFRFSALDYLLKPVDPDELIVAVGKVQQQLDAGYKTQLGYASKNYTEKEFDKIVLRDIDNIYLVPLSDITFCKADGNYTEFNFVAAKPILVSRNLKDYEIMLNESGFLRIHRSCLINLKHFKSYEKSEGGTVILSDDTKVPVASGKKDDLFKFLTHFKG